MEDIRSVTTTANIYKIKKKRIIKLLLKSDNFKENGFCCTHIPVNWI